MSESLSKPVSQLRAKYEVLVIGSGYGGGVAASRLARAGREVCLLERGREIRPGEYPNTLLGAGAELQVETPSGQIGNPLGLFDVHTNEDMNVVVGCGLGGTSLINANVSLEVKKDLFSKQPWPQAFADDPGLLDDYYREARAMLGAISYPQTFPELNKLTALEHSARAMGKHDQFYRPPINVTFEAGPNHAGVHQDACTLCGDCCSGCNYGAKNTTLMNYLPDAVHHGAEIFCGVEALKIARVDGAWRVSIAARAGDNSLPHTEVLADIVMLAAGTLGSAEILLRSKAAGLGVSDRLGQQFSGNGDVLAFGYNAYWDKDKPKEHAGDLVDALKAAYSEMTEDAKSLSPSPIYGIGTGDNIIPKAKLPGPCITGIIDLRDEDAPLEERLVVEEGAIPGALATGVAPAFFFRNATEGEFFTYGPTEAAARLQDAQRLGDMMLAGSGDFASAAYEGPASRTQTYLVMSHDNAGGTLRLDDNDHIRVDWPGAGLHPAIQHDAEVLEAACEGVDSQYLPNPIWTEPFGHQLVTVHPVGGCAMADDAAKGVVNDRCQVFADTTGDTVHDGLYVCDGSVMPAGLGVNPLLTISAIAERACALLCDARGWSFDYAANAVKEAPPAAKPEASPSAPVSIEHVEHAKEVLHAYSQDPGNAKPDLADKVGSVLGHVEDWLGGEGRKLGESVLRDRLNKNPEDWSPTMEFKETMRGFFTASLVRPSVPLRERISDDYRVAERMARAAGERMIGNFTVKSDSLQVLVNDPSHEAHLTGEIVIDALSSEPFELQDGRFNLFAVDADKVSTWLMKYRGWLTKDGKRVGYLDARKILHQTDGSSWWADTTTLYVDVFEDDQKGAARLGQGVITLSIDALLKQITTIKMEPASWQLDILPDKVFKAVQYLVLAHFAGFFGKTLLKAYGGLIADLANFPKEANEEARKTRREINAPPKSYYSHTDVAGKFSLTRYPGGDRGPVLLAPGFSVTAASFATTTVDENLVEYLTARNFDVWLFDYRASPMSGCATEPFTIDDIAKEDWFKAVDFVRKVTHKPDVQVVAHCVGSMSLMMALCSGLTGVRSAVLSQLTLHPVTGWLNYLKADIGLVGVLERKGFDTLSIEGGDSLEDKKMDAMLWKVPMPPGEDCKNPVCHRIFSVFGPSYTHSQLNEATHNALVEMFGEISSKPFEQLTRMIEGGLAVDQYGQDVYLPNVSKLALPLDFLAGSRNEIFYPETSRRTYDWLCAHNGPAHYTRTVFPDYAHMDFFIGKNAAQDIFPHIVNRLELHS